MIYIYNKKRARFSLCDYKCIACRTVSPGVCKHSSAPREGCKGNIVESIIPLCYSGKIRTAPCTTQKHGNLVSHAIIAHAISPPKKRWRKKKKLHVARDKMGRSNVVCDAKYLIESFISCVRNYFSAARLSFVCSFCHCNDSTFVHFGFSRY